jgi:hypothetical protein
VVFYRLYDMVKYPDKYRAFYRGKYDNNTWNKLNSNNTLSLYPINTENIADSVIDDFGNLNVYDDCDISNIMEND